MTVRAAVVGCGAIGSLYDDGPGRDDPRSHAGAMASNPNIDLVAGSDVDDSRRREFERRWDRPCYATHQALLADQQVDLVSICTPPDAHVDIALDAVAGGVAGVFCEKPMGGDVAGGRRIVTACEEAGVLLAVNHLRRWDPVHQEAADQIRSGGIGVVQHITVLYTRGVMNSGVHAVDVVRLFGGEVDAVRATDRLGELGAEQDPALDAYLTLAAGGAASLVGCQRGHHDIFEVDVVGTTGRIRFEDLGYRLRSWAPGRHARWVEEVVLVETSVSNAMRGVMSHAMAALVDGLAGRPVACTGADGLAALAVVEAMIASATAGSAARAPERVEV